ncbi:MAG: RelE protein [archaeon GW2011_AR17]|nr:MAG: RelE protein [archaeon GW2011_AR17]MBS3154565.1 type II toxin-antitoxin system RelE/ParE family toxin [Candidatus Woesearchaeota archaeon]HIH15522.1 type II toxin-antitoxin system RelE/ParE family toxin [Nanoarchaeota archaeon]HIH59509.1 type II toxin-antitoxin system RelE/ParE family toxin [Nanoarchaeota archaeon]HII14113.1 type II toxin-antitoxin system RelE/ParE family toxin [Nanoarchaeota archaeon]
MYEIVFTDKAKKELKKLDRAIQERILDSLERIRIRPEAYITKLVGDPSYKFRVGDYRILLDIDQERLILLVIKVGHRKNVYDEKR